MDWWGILSTGWWVNVAAGLISGGIVSLVFFWLGGRQLLRLARQINLILRGMEEGGLVKFSRDARGEIVGIIFERRIGGGLIGGGQADVSLKKSPP